MPSPMSPGPFKGRTPCEEACVLAGLHRSAAGGFVYLFCAEYHPRHQGGSP